MKNIGVLVIIICSFLKVQVGFSQEDTTKYKPKIVALPLIFFQPETKLGFGGAGFLSFKTNCLDTNLRVSQVNLGAAYTLQKQVLTYASFDIWTPKNNYNIYGELGYYRYFYYFYGVGNGDRFEETYNVNYPRIRISAEKKIIKGLYAGVKYSFDDFDIVKRDSAGQLIQNIFTGSEGGKISGAGISAKYDTRDNNFYPTSGWKVNGSSTLFHPKLGSDFKYLSTEIDVIKYFGFGKDRVLATYAYGRFINNTGDAPFFNLSQVGGNKRMRGYYEGYYRDKQMIGWQAEYRTPVWWRLGLVGFIGNAVVADEVNNFQLKNFRTTAGAGLRIQLDTERKVNLRIDYGFSKETSGFYLTIGEAF